MPSVQKELTKYFEVFSDLAALATILDPQFKMDYYLGENEEKSDTYYNHLRLANRYLTDKWNSSAVISPPIVSVLEEANFDTTQGLAFLKRRNEILAVL
jgi:hypothetical protein